MILSIKYFQKRIYLKYGCYCLIIIEKKKHFLTGFKMHFPIKIFTFLFYESMEKDLI